MNVQPLLDFIGQPESRGNYDAVWGGIKAKDRPPKPITQMTIGQVLAWQDSIDAKYPSEAAGKYQIMEDTLRPLPPAAGLTVNDLFNKTNQDKLATVLLRRRGLDDFAAGKITAETFANNLAHEWASLPLVSGPKAGRSVYAGDGLNKSHVSVPDFLAAVKAVTAATSHVNKTPKREHFAPDVLTPATAPQPAQAPATAETPQSLWAWLLAALAGLFKPKGPKA